LTPLVVHRGAIGDLIRLTAMLRALYERWGRPCDLVAGKGPVRPVFANLETVGEIRTLKSQGYPHLVSPGQRSLLRWLRGREPSPVYMVDTRRRRFALRTRMTRMEWLLERAGVTGDQQLSSQSLPRPRLEHLLDYELRMARQDPPDFAGAAPGTFPDPAPAPELALTAAERAEYRETLAEAKWEEQPLILIQATARRSHRGLWPTEKWVKLARELLKLEPKGWIGLVGAPGESPQLETLRRAIADSRVKNLSPGLTLRRLFALLEHAHSMISQDTGPAHAAAALGCPVVVLAGRADPRRNRPAGPPEKVQLATAFTDDTWPASVGEWWRLHHPADIRVDTVIDAWSRLDTESRQLSAAT
jgi:heptosyltransferase-2/heptosyltransferase-3